MLHYWTVGRIGKFSFECVLIDVGTCLRMLQCVYTIMHTVHLWFFTFHGLSGGPFPHPSAPRHNRRIIEEQPKILSFEFWPGRPHVGRQAFNNNRLSFFCWCKCCMHAWNVCTVASHAVWSTAFSQSPPHCQGQPSAIPQIIGRLTAHKPNTHLHPHCHTEVYLYHHMLTNTTIFYRAYWRRIISNY